MSGVQARREADRRLSAAREPYIANTQEEPLIADRQRDHQTSELIQVQPYQKKYLQGVPGSSPVIRAHDDLNFQQKYGKGPLMERAERLKRLHELKENMNQRVNDREQSDDGVVRMVKDNRVKRIGA